MYRLSRTLILSACICFVTGAAVAQEATATCNFDPAKQLTVRYQRIQLHTKKNIWETKFPMDKCGRREENP